MLPSVVSTSNPVMSGSLGSLLPRPYIRHTQIVAMSASIRLRSELVVSRLVGLHAVGIARSQAVDLAEHVGRMIRRMTFQHTRDRSFSVDHDGQWRAAAEAFADGAVLVGEDRHRARLRCIPECARCCR